MTAVNLLDFDLAGLAAYCEGLGEKRFRATQLFRWLHQRGVSDCAQMSDLAKSFRDKLGAACEVRVPAVLSEQASSDGTIKWLFDVGGGRLPFLFDWSPGLQPQPHDCRDRRATLVR